MLHRILWHTVILEQPAPEISVFLITAYLVISAVTALLGFVLQCLPGKTIFEIRTGRERRWQKATITHIYWILGVLTIVTGWIVTKISLLDLFAADGLQGALRIFTAIFTPEWSITGTVLLATLETIYLALMATLVALPLSFILSFFAARNIVDTHKSLWLVYAIVRFIANLTRSIEPLIWAIVFSVWVGIGPFAGMLALAIHTVASLIKQYSEQIEDIDQGPVEAIEATGASALQMVWFAIVPQIVLPFLSITIYRWDINVRMATVIGLVGGGGIGTLLVQYQGLAKWHEVGLIVIIIATVVWIMDYGTAKIREAIR